MPDAAAPPGAASRRIARNAALQAGAEVVGKVATLALTVVAARALTQQRFGAYSYALSFAPLVAVVWSWGLGTLLIREASAEPDKLPALYNRFVLLRALIAIPSVVVFGFLGALTRPYLQARLVLVLVLVAWALNSFREAAVSAGFARQEVAGVTAAVVVDRLVTAGLGIVALVLGAGVVGLGVAFLAGSIIGLVVSQRAVRRLGVKLDLRGVDRSQLRPMLGRSFYIGVDTIVSESLFRIDAIMLSAFKGDVALAIYSVAYRLLETVLFVSWAIVRALFPAMSARGGAQVKRGVEEGIASMAVLFVPFAVVLLAEAEDVISLLFGEAYAEGSAPVARWLALGPMLFGVAYLTGYGLQALDRARSAFGATMTAALFNIGANLVMIPLLGGVGAAITTCVAYAIEAGLSLWLLRDIGLPTLGRRLLPPVLGGSVMALVLVVVELPILIELTGVGALYLLVWYLVAKRVAPEQVAIVGALVPGRR
ncbi:MAG: flippase [Actinomycetota bacterium]|nr:flippase [Actinomycetota bacterium]